VCTGTPVHYEQTVRAHTGVHEQCLRAEHCGKHAAVQRPNAARARPRAGTYTRPLLGLT